ncbi:MAG: hypothetical protein RIB45_03740 [Marivibrio sp.]|uniref:hypothetical protein n=1 Tax=Marivibrio sp. TaxID=2039719 RepID=UPI0032EF833B
MTAKVLKDENEEFDGDIRRDPKQVHRRQRGKNLAVAGLVVAFVVIVYLVSIVKMSSGY